ncbi:hypothetical protein LNTAR_00805 [Lentisphaera araneosa HTCC2155]|uniref:Uncharacterized protein n=1 Tax=Lentisphaera araneosa HTCC2155 TaxID=313628 RepID=A6DKJ8_9BACT|nr:hypothetical protein [Lentisphaera araneosa]EDM27896.1 hypothetical protein LNTAR_00805 [Lentisphaera araneosa HTCC2155]
MQKLYLSATIFIALLSVLHKPAPAISVENVTWPQELEGKKLQPLAMGEQEKVFLKHFPGKVARFHDGENEYILRQVTRPSRKFHSASVCLKSNGAKISFLPLFKDSRSRLWSQFNAEWKGKHLLVSEIIIDQDHKTISDASSWYWKALFKQTRGPWLSITKIQKNKEGE